MPKAKLTFPAEEAKKLLVAANFTNVTLGEAQRIGKNLIVETSYRDAQSLINMSRLMSEVSGNELDAKAEKADAKAAKK